MTVVVSVWASDERKNYLQSVVRCIEWDIKRLKTIISLYDKRSESYTADDIVAKFDKQANEQSLFSFTQGVICQLKQLNRIRTSETYAATLSSFMKFRDGLRAVYNRAVEKELVEQKHPFKHVYTGIDKTVKRAVPLKVIKRIKELDLTLKPHLDYARDMFLFSFYTRGMSFIDMAYLKKSDLKNSVITYRRKKTSQQLTIKWEKCMAEIVAKYKDRNATQYLLPIITDPLADERIQYRNALCRVNVALKEVARLANLSIPLTMYCGRHSWASVAKSKNIPISVISEGMGHDSEETTRIYLASLDSNVIDKANSLILKDL